MCSGMLVASRMEASMMRAVWLLCWAQSLFQRTANHPQLLLIQPVDLSSAAPQVCAGFPLKTIAKSCAFFETEPYLGTSWSQQIRKILTGGCPRLVLLCLCMKHLRTLLLTLSIKVADIGIHGGL